MIDHFNLVEKFISNRDELFSLVHILIRAKDHPGEKITKSFVKTYFIKNKEQLREYKQEIVTLCNVFKARAYITISEKSYKKFQDALLVKLAEYNKDSVYRNPERILDSVAMKLKGLSDLWILDVDDPKIEPKLIDYITKDSDIKRNKCWIFAKIPTLQGFHLITSKFDSLEFHKLFPDIIIHKNPLGTVLYIPDSVCNLKK